MKKFKHLVSGLTAIAAGLLLMTSSITTAYALPVTSGTETEPAQAKLYKNIVMPAGVETPSGNATFKFTAKTVDGNQGTTTNMPVIADQSVAFSTTDTGTTEDGVKTVSKQSGNLLAGIEWPHAGEYVYTVTENPNTFTLTNNTTTSEWMQYSSAQYDMHVVVANGSTANSVYVQYVYVTNQTPGASNLGSKMDDSSTEGTGFAFTNKFNRSHNVDPTNPTNPDAGLAVYKNVDGSTGDQTAYFDFSITVNDPATLAEGATHGTYHAIIVEGGHAIDPTTNNDITSADNNHTFAVTEGTALTFKLKHGQSLVFTDLQVGATYQVSETNAMGHTPYVKVKQNGHDGTEIQATSSGDTALYVTEGADSVTFRNHKEQSTPTGISINDLPYLMLVGFAAAAFVVVASKKRREA